MTYGLILPLYDAQAGGSERESIETLNIIAEEVARMTVAPALVDLFGLRRPPKSTWREDYAKQLIAATPTPTVSLRQSGPVDCIVRWSDWTPWQPYGTLEEERYQYATVVTPAAFGGKPCPTQPRSERRLKAQPTKPKKKWWVFWK